MARGDGSIKPATNNGKQIYRDGKPVFRVRFVDPADGKQKQRNIAGREQSEALLAKYKVHKTSNTTRRFVPASLTFADMTMPFLDAYKTRLSGEARPYATWHKVYSIWHCYVLPQLRNRQIGTVTTLELVAFIRELTRADNGAPLAPGTRQNISHTLKAF